MNSVIIRGRHLGCCCCCCCAISAAAAAAAAAASSHKEKNLGKGRTIAARLLVFYFRCSYMHVPSPASTTTRLRIGGIGSKAARGTSRDFLHES